MQRLFFAFPGGLPGLGLLLLRIALGATALYEGQSVLLRPATPATLPWVFGVVGALALTSVIVGFLTPIGCAVLALELAGALCLPWLGYRSSMESRLLGFDFFVIALATGALGPGAFSVDARLFGRREIIFPR